jgi:hypothetical protein
MFTHKKCIGLLDGMKKAPRCFVLSAAKNHKPLKKIFPGSSHEFLYPEHR